MSTLHELFRQQAHLTPDRTVVFTADGSAVWTLEHLDRITDFLAIHFVRSFRCCLGSSVAIFMEKSPEYVVVYIAALKAGAGYLPIDISYPKMLIENVLKEANPVVICTKEELKSRLTTIETPIPMFIFDKNWQKQLPSEFNLDELPKVGPDDLAYIIYSSGTTGKPKGICCPHRGAVLSYNFRFLNFPYEDDDRTATNVFFIWEMFRSILKGSKMYIIPDDVIYDPLALCSFLHRNKITRMLFTPSLLEMILDTQSDDRIRTAFSSFRILWLCGEVVTSSLLKRIVTTLNWVRVLNLYSVSECHDVAVCDLSQWYEQSGSTNRMMSKYSPVGRLIPNVHVVILDNGMHRLPIGMPGEIYVGGSTLAIGYLNRPEMNRARFVKTPIELVTQIGDRLYRTGDWGYLLADGRLEICGRCDTLVKIRGYSIEIQFSLFSFSAVESTLLLLPAILSCAVVSIGAEGDDKQLAAYVVLNEPKSRKDLRAELKHRLPFYMVPSFFIFLDKLPILPASSKVDKKALPPVDLHLDVMEADALPQTPIERRLARVWAEVLGLSTVDIQENFFDLGGHSLLAARLLQKVSVEFGTVLSVRDLFANSTISLFARILEGDHRQSPVHVVDLCKEVELHDLKDNVLVHGDMNMNQIMDLYLRAFWRSTVWENRFFHACVLLTGATGFLGTFILRDLLHHSKVRVICLVRENPQESGEQRLRYSLRKYGLLDELLLEQLNERVSVIGGDVALIKFGLKDEDYHLLSYDIDVVIHAAAYVNLIYPYQALHGVNVLGTHNVLDFCHKNKVKPLHYISTDAVIPNGCKNFAETDNVDDAWKELSSYNGYAQTKWVAEQLVIRSLRRGLPVVIYRLGNQAGHSKLASWNSQDFIYLMLFACTTLNSSPQLDWSVEMTPVDFSAHFITVLATRHFCANTGKIYHLMQTDRPDWKAINDWIRSCGYRLKDESYSLWTDRIEKATVCSEVRDENLFLLHRLLEVMACDQTFFSKQSTYIRENTDSLLSELNWSYPIVNEKQFDRWLKRMAKQGSIPPPATLSGKLCIVTGASEGIGEAISFSLAVDVGAQVVLVARRQDCLDRVRRRIVEAGGKAASFRCDITDDEQTKMMAVQFDKVDVLVNCAGLMCYSLMSKCDRQDDWHRQIDVNCKGTMNCIGAVLPTMIKNKSGHIVNITSDAGKKAFPGLAVYSGTKFFLEGMSSALRQEMAPLGIKVSNVQPGDVITQLANKNSDPEARKLYDGTLRNERVLNVNDVARAVVFVLVQPAHVAVNELLVEPTSAPT